MFEIPNLWFLLDPSVHQTNTCLWIINIALTMSSGVFLRCLSFGLGRLGCWPSEVHLRFQLHKNSKKERPGCGMAQWLNTHRHVKTLGSIPSTIQKDKWKNRWRTCGLASVCPHTHTSSWESLLQETVEPVSFQTWFNKTKYLDLRKRILNFWLNMVSKAKMSTSHDTRSPSVISVHGRLLRAQAAWTAC